MGVKSYSIEKILSANDIGDTGGHQAGILVPKDEKILNFFPKLDKTVKNPRAILDMKDDTGKEWTFSFIYYNNRLFGGTRNEFRLTGMTAYFREFDLKTGDTLIFNRVDKKNVTISYRRANSKNTVIKLSSTWKVIDTDF
jgi:hypothetical protein